MPVQQTDTQAQVGIGTLIVFIAMVLVAAIAAGVLVNTAGFLQVQAEDTGEESTEQVADNLNVITEVGVIGDSDQRVDEIRIGVQPAAGAGVLNLEEVTAQFVSDNSFGTFVHVKSASTTSASAVFNTESVTSDNGENNIMTENTDRYELVFPLGDQRPFVEEAVVLDGGEETPLAISEDGEEVLAADDENADRPAKLDLVVDNAVNIDNIADEFDGVEAVTEVAVEDGEAQNAGGAELFADAGITDATNLNDDDDFETSADTAGFGDTDDVQRVVAFTEEVDAEALDGFDEETAELDDEFLAALDNDDGLAPLEESEEAELTLTTEVGAQTVAVLKVPDTLASETEGDGVDL